MSDKYKNDQIAIEEIKKVTGGARPEAYFCADSGHNFGIFMALAGPLFGWLLSEVIGKTYLIALEREHIYFIRTNGKCNKFKGEHFKIHKSEIRESECKKRSKLHRFKIKLQDGKTHKFEANEGFIHLEDRPGNIDKFKRFLGIYQV